MAEFAYNNAKNVSTRYTLFELNSWYHSRVIDEEDVDPHSRSKIADKLIKKLRNLIAAYRKNLQYA